MLADSLLVFASALLSVGQLSGLGGSEVMETTTTVLAILIGPIALMVLIFWLLDK